MKEAKLVYPGDFLGYEEEFLAGIHTYADDEGKVYSDSVGFKDENAEEHEVNVNSLKGDVKIIEKGCIVTGIVYLVKTHGVVIELKMAELNGKKRVVHDSMASLAVFNISREYVKSTEDMFRVGDIVKAKVIDVSPYGIELDTKFPEYGVIKAFGKKSRMPLHLISGKLRDPLTGDTETRKISSEYLLR